MVQTTSDLNSNFQLLSAKLPKIVCQALSVICICSYTVTAQGSAEQQLLKILVSWQQQQLQAGKIADASTAAKASSRLQQSRDLGVTGIVLPRSSPSASSVVAETEAPAVPSSDPVTFTADQVLWMLAASHRAASSSLPRDASQSPQEDRESEAMGSLLQTLIQRLQQPGESAAITNPHSNGGRSDAGHDCIHRSTSTPASGQPEIPQSLCSVSRYSDTSSNLLA